MSHTNYEGIKLAAAAAITAVDSEILRKVATLATVDAPVQFTGDWAKFNPLVELAKEDSEAFGRVCTLIREKRAAVSLRTATTPVETFDSVAYQRVYMAERRERLRKALDIENSQRSPHNQLKGKAKEVFFKAQYEKWVKARDEHVAAVRLRQGHDFEGDGKRQAAREYWDQLDASLDDQIRKLGKR